MLVHIVRFFSRPVLGLTLVACISSQPAWGAGAKGGAKRLSSGSVDVTLTVSDFPNGLQLARGTTTATAEHSGRLVTGWQRVVARVPANVPVERYENDGYQLVVSDSGTGAAGQEWVEIVVVVRLDGVGAPGSGSWGLPGEPGSHSVSNQEPAAINWPEVTPFSLDEPTSTPQGALAYRLARKAQFQEEAVASVLDWIARNVEFKLDRSSAQDAQTVLERRSAFCTGYARLAVSMLQELGITAREVPGYALVSPSNGPAGFHRWIEIYYPGTGWRFSDPQGTIDFVPATFLRLSEETVPPGTEDPNMWVLKESRGAISAVTADPALRWGLERPHRGEAVKGAHLRILSSAAKIRLQGDDWVLEQKSRNGSVEFVDLKTGSYRVSADQEPASVAFDQGVEIEKAARYQLVVRARN